MTAEVGAYITLQASVAHAYGVLERLNSTDGSPDPSFDSDGQLFTSGPGDVFLGALATPTQLYTAGAVDTGNGSANTSLRRYLSSGALDSSFGTLHNGIALVPSPTSTSAILYVYSVVVDSSKRVIALCSDGTNLWLSRWSSKGILDSTYGIPGGSGVALPFGLNQTAFSPVGIKILTDDRVVVLANSGSGAAGFSLARMSVSGNPDLVSTGNSFGQVGTVGVARDLAVSRNNDIAVVGQSTAGDFGMVILGRDSIVPDKLVVSFTSTHHFSEYPHNPTFGSGVAWDDWLGDFVVVIGVSAGNPYPAVAGLKIPVRRFQPSGSTWQLDTAWSSIWTGGTLPQTSPPNWKIAPTVNFTSLMSQYYIAGSSVSPSSSLMEFEVIKLNGGGTFGADLSFGNHGGMHVGTAGHNIQGMGIAVTTDSKPVLFGVAF